jgi:hypothetical protein
VINEVGIRELGVPELEHFEGDSRYGGFIKTATNRNLKSQDRLKTEGPNGFGI